MAMTPRLRSRAPRLSSFASAPRSLNEPVGCSVSSFSTISAPEIAESAGEGRDGVRNTELRIAAAAASISAKATGSRLTSVPARERRRSRRHRRRATGHRATAARDRPNARQRIAGLARRDHEARALRRGHVDDHAQSRPVPVEKGRGLVGNIHRAGIDRVRAAVGRDRRVEPASHKRNLRPDAGSRTRPCAPRPSATRSCRRHSAR